jgi:hypothetical protein
MAMTQLAATLASLSLASPTIRAQLPEPGQTTQAQNSDSEDIQSHVITVSRSGVAYAKPDLGILLMSSQSTSPIADEAVADFGKPLPLYSRRFKAADVELRFGDHDRAGIVQFRR